ncbi:MAG: EAL domain-containing protein [Cellvibrionaceae bacterium]|nr:EAL domain-containing protein [Cellvibrionaceae bacterium]
MPKQLAAVDLMRRFYQLVVSKPHRELVLWLLKNWSDLPYVSRVVLLTNESGEHWVRGTGVGENLTVLNTDLSNFRRIASEQVHHCYNSATPQFYAVSELAKDKKGFLDSSLTLACVPIGEGDEPIGQLYLELNVEAAQAEQLLQERQQLQVFCGLVLQHLIVTWQHQQQLEKAKVAEQALWASEVYLRSILDHSPVFISVVDLGGNVILSSDHHLNDELSQSASTRYNGHHVYALFPEKIAQALWPGKPESEEDVNADWEFSYCSEDDGETKYYWINRFPLLDQQGKLFASCAICTDITERKHSELAMQEQQKRLNYLAFHDELTGLPNRTLFHERLLHSLARAKRNHNQVAIMLLDVDRFKYINDSFGHDAGDALLKVIAERLVSCVREVDTVARLGGDEFVLVIEDIQHQSDVALVTEKILNISAEPFELRGYEITSTLSIGVSVFPADGEDSEALLKHADVAMYRAKDDGKNTYRLFDHSMNEQAVQSLLRENELRKAIKNNQLKLLYQPKIDLHNTEVIGVEALVRWDLGDGNFMSPADFIPLAEETGLIVPLGEWVLDEACRQQRSWLDSGLNIGSVAVNLSPRQFLQGEFSDFIKSVLDKHSLPPSSLELEITETSAMENAEQSVLMLKRLHAMGVALAMDDFGTGYSSLAYLKRFPIDTLKIDRSFIRDIYQDKNDAAIAKSIIDLGHNMGLKVVAEGIETSDQKFWLKKQGCDYAQGFYFSKPISAQEIEESLFSIKRKLELVANNNIGLGI